MLARRRHHRDRLARGSSCRRTRPTLLLWAARIRCKHGPVLRRPIPVDHGARERQFRRVVDRQAEIVEARRRGLEIERRQQDRGIDRAGLQRRRARRGRAREHHVELARLDAVRRQHALDDRCLVMSFGPPSEITLPLSSFRLLDARTWRAAHRAAPAPRRATIAIGAPLRRWRGSDRPARSTW